MTTETKAWLLQRGDFEIGTHEYWSESGWVQSWRHAVRFETEDAAMIVRNRVNEGTPQLRTFGSDRHGTYCLSGNV